MRNFDRIFITGIIFRQNNHVRIAVQNLAKLRALLRITLAGTAGNGNDTLSFWRDGTGKLAYLLNAVRCMGKVNDDVEGLAFIDALHSAFNLLEMADLRQHHFD